MPSPTRHIRSANDEFQLLRALLTNRNKRHRQGRFLVHGVRSIDRAVACGWRFQALVVREGERSRWADDLLASGVADENLLVDGGLLDQLSERDDGAEIVGVAATPAIGLSSFGERRRRGPIVVTEAIRGPGNLGTILRSAEALGGGGLVVTGHAADLFDPLCVRASTGALFSHPVATAASVGEVADALGGPLIGLDADGDCIDSVDLPPSAVLVAGTEATGLSRAAKDRCDALASIPMHGVTDSLNVSTAVAIALAEAARRQRAGGGG